LFFFSYDPANLPDTTLSYLKNIAVRQDENEQVRKKQQNNKN
jgi:hypothetical protein